MPSKRYEVRIVGPDAHDVLPLWSNGFWTRRGAVKRARELNIARVFLGAKADYNYVAWDLRTNARVW